MRAGQCNGVKAIARLDGRVAVRVEKIVKELHVELIVLDN